MEVYEQFDKIFPGYYKNPVVLILAAISWIVVIKLIKECIRWLERCEQKRG